MSTVQIAGIVRTTTSADTVREMLAAMTVAQIDALAAELGICLAGNKAARIATLVHHGVQRRLDSAAIARA